MPKTLINRCRPDSVGEFRIASRERFLDGQVLAANGRRTAAIYMWGYVAEMTLKAAYFHVLGFSVTQTITVADLRSAKTNSTLLGLTWVGNLHHLESWARLLINTRVYLLNRTYTPTTFGNQIISKAMRIQKYWSESIRYHKNTAYGYEANHVQEDTEWLLLNSLRL